MFCSKGPNQANSIHCTTKEQQCGFGIFWSMDKMIWNDVKKWQELLVPTNPDLCDVLGRTDLIVRSCISSFDWLHMFRCPGSHIFRHGRQQLRQWWRTNPQIPTWPLLATHQRMKYIARSPCCDFQTAFDANKPDGPSPIQPHPPLRQQNLDGTSCEPKP